MGRNRSERDVARTAFYGGLLALTFAWGLATAVFHIFPYDPLLFAWRSTLALRHEFGTVTGLEPTQMLGPKAVDGDGVTTLVPDRMAPGRTLLAGFFDDTNELRLIEPDGSVVRRWPVPFSRIFPDPDHIQPPSRQPATDWNIDTHGMVALPDGSVIFNYEYGGLVKLDRCGTVVWTLPRMTHHFVAPGESGELWVGDRRWVTDRADRATPFLKMPHWEDRVLRVSSSGEVLQELSIPGVLAENGLMPLITANGNFRTRLVEDFAHLNDAEPLPDSLADRFPGFEAGDLLVSLRNLNLVFVVDPDTREIRWHRTGPWIRQHDPDYTPRGTITVFDNRVDGTARGTLLGGSRIVEVDPETGEVRTRFEGARHGDFYTNVRGGHQYLDNGNLLVAESRGGRAIEVDSAGATVWEYVNRYDDTRAAFVSNATRYPPGYFTVDDWSCGPGS